MPRKRPTPPPHPPAPPMPPNFPRPDEPAPSPIELIAAGAHGLWCQRMIQEGWSYAQVYNAIARRHDALVPFANLSDDDRADTIEHIQLEGLDQDLANTVEYLRGANRPLTLGEMCVGLRLEADFGLEDGSLTPILGRVIAWSVHPRTGRLDTFRVLWDTGEESEHIPLEQDVRRVSTPPGEGPFTIRGNPGSTPP